MFDEYQRIMSEVMKRACFFDDVDDDDIVVVLQVIWS